MAQNILQLNDCLSHFAWRAVPINESFLWTTVDNSFMLLLQSVINGLYYGQTKVEIIENGKSSFVEYDKFSTLLLPIEVSWTSLFSN